MRRISDPDLKNRYIEQHALQEHLSTEILDALGLQIFEIGEYIYHQDDEAHTFYILVDGKKVNRPSYRVKPGMAGSIREKSRKIPMVVEGVTTLRVGLPEYLERAEESFEGKMIATPNLETIPFKTDTAGVIGFYSR